MTGVVDASPSQPIPCSSDVDCSDGDARTTDACIKDSCDNAPVMCAEGERCNPTVGSCVSSRPPTGKPTSLQPSGMVPIDTKPNVSKRRKKPGVKPGHQGVPRERPVKIDEHKTHRLKCCPHCSGKLQRCDRSYTRIIKDIPEVIESIVTQHAIHRDYCPNCRRHVEPVGTIMA